MGRYPKITEEEKANILKDYADGMHTRELAAKYHRCSSGINKLVREAGIGRRMQKVDRTSRNIEIIQRYKAGQTIEEIAKEVGEYPSTVKWVIDYDAQKIIPELIKYAPEFKPKAHPVVIDEKRYLDVSEFWGL